MQTGEMRTRARAIAAAGGMDAALAAGTLPGRADVSVSEGVVLGLVRQRVTKFFGILGHGTTDIGEVLRVYAEEGVVRFIHCRNEVAMAHAATALAWIYGETAAVVTSIGPGALQAFAGSLAAASNGIGVYHLYGDETTHGEGPNMQQIPGTRQGQFGRLTETMGPSFTLHTPEALRDALRRGTQAVHRRVKPAPFYLSLPINVQPKIIHGLRLDALPERSDVTAFAPAPDVAYDRATEVARRHARIVIKAGGGAIGAPDAVRRLAERLGAVVVLSPRSTGVLPDAHPLNMHVGGSKGTISGNFAMEQADLLIAVGSRAVCQADCSGTGYPNVKDVININADADDAEHYNHTTALVGDVGAVIDRWLARLGNDDGGHGPERSAFLAACGEKKAEWRRFKAERTGEIRLDDATWGRPVLALPSAVAALARASVAADAVKVFDAGDVQANGFQIVEDQKPGESITEAGASYMGFAVSSLLASAAADRPRYLVAFTGDGSFFMNPQILIDAVVHKVRGMIVVFDNRRMAAISSLQEAQYGADFATSDDVAVDYAAMASAVPGVKGLFGGWTLAEFEAAIAEGRAHDGLSLIHLPVYWGDHPLGGMGAYGRWNVGPWVEAVERLYAEQTI